jgi:hypothetical protein
MESKYNIKHKSSFGVVLTQDEFEKARADEWHTTMVFGTDCKAPRTLDKVDRYEGESHYDYIGAPGGEEWPIPNTWMVNKIDNVDDDGNLVNDIYVRPKQVINLNTWEVDTGVYGTIRGISYPVDKNLSISQLEEDFNKRANIELEKYYVGNTFNAQAAIQDGVPTSVAIKHMLDNKYQEQLTKEMQDYDTWLLNQMISKGDGRTGGGLYSKLHNLNINKGQGDMFSYTNNNPAAKP